MGPSWAEICRNYLPRVSDIENSPNRKEELSASLDDIDMRAPLDGDVDEEDDELAASLRIPVTTQYWLLFQDSCYIFMFLAGSQIFGILGAVGGSLVQEVMIWGKTEVEG